MDKSNKIENLANKYVERHIRDRHLSDDTIKEIKIAYIMIIKDFIAIVDKSTSFHGKEYLIYKDPDPEGSFIIVGVNFRILPAGTPIVTI